MRSSPRKLSLGSVLATVAVAEFMLVLDVSIVNVALPTIRGDLGFSETGLQWVVNAYAVTFGGFLLLGGRAADLYGGKRVFTGTLGLFTLASLACGLAPGGAFLIGARAVQGFAASLLSPATLSILTGTFAGDERKRAIAIWSGVAIGGGAVGAILGGLLTELLSWRWIFFVNVPVGAILLVVGLHSLPASTKRGRPRLDLPGAVTVTVSLLALVLAFVRSSVVGWSSWQTLLPLLAGVALVAVFLVIEWRLASEPLVPLSIFRSRPVAVGNLLMFSSFMAVVATWFFLTLYLQIVRHYSPLDAGLFFLPLSLVVIAASQIGFKLTGRLSGRVVTGVGGLLAGVGLLWLGRIGVNSSLLAVAAPALISMTGSGLMYAPITLASTAEIAPELVGLASGLLNATRQLGGAFGLAVLTTVAIWKTHAASGNHTAALTAGYRDAFDGGALFFLLAAILGLLLLPALRGDANTERARGNDNEASTGIGRGREERRAA
jgi:EmrB/QacA subfamily drug resistance transporter